MNATLPEPLATAGFTPEQKEYLSGLFAGAAARGQKFSDVEPAPTHEDLIFEERVKRELHPLDAYEQLIENAIGNKAPDKEDIFASSGTACFSSRRSKMRSWRGCGFPADCSPLFSSAN